MNPYLITIDDSESFVVFLTKHHSMGWSGNVYPCLVSQSGWMYHSKKNSDYVENIEEAECFFEFSYCWRGVWEGRFYPKQEEYWGEDVSTLHELWVQIEKGMRNQIRNDNPDYDHFDKDYIDPVQNCLIYALRFWEQNPKYRLFYNSDHVVNLPEGVGDLVLGPFLTLESFSYDFIRTSFAHALTDPRDQELLKKYFEV